MTCFFPSVAPRRVTALTCALHRVKCEQWAGREDMGASAGGGRRRKGDSIEQWMGLHVF